MFNAKQQVDNLIVATKKGEIPPNKSWNEIKKLKEQYIQQYSEQSWHSYIGHRFQDLIYSILKGYFDRVKSQNPEFWSLDVLTQDEIKRDSIIERKIAVKYDKYLLLPDTDIAIIDRNFVKPWESKILAVINCKTSLRERIAQACYWKLKLLSSDITKNIQVCLATTDSDEDFSIRNERKKFEGKHRNRIIAEYELDGIYILREDFRKDWESSKVKCYEAIFDDLVRIFKATHKK